MKRTPVLLIGIVTVGIGSYFAVTNLVLPPSRPASIASPASGDRAEHSHGEPSSSAEETAALRAGMARLNAEMAALRAQMAANPPSDTAGAREGSPDPEPPRRNMEERARQAEAWHEHMREVGADFQREAVDATWASSTTSALESALEESDALRDRVRGVQCRAQTCRIELDDDRGGAMGKDFPMFVHKFVATFPNTQADHVDDGNGHRTMVLYMTSKDSAAPPITQVSRR